MFFVQNCNITGTWYRFSSIIHHKKIKLIFLKRNKSELVFVKGMEMEELRQELVKCELHNEELLTELKAREKDIIAEKREAEKVRALVLVSLLIVYRELS